jgi:hypothetical protein
VPTPDFLASGAAFAGGFPPTIPQAVGMAKRNKMVKFVVPAAIAVGKGALARWPIFVAAMGGALVHRMWSSRRMRRVTASTVAPWASNDTRVPGDVSSSRPSGTTRTGSSATPTTDAWSPTAPTGL